MPPKRKLPSPSVPASPLSTANDHTPHPKRSRPAPPESNDHIPNTTSMPDPVTPFSPAPEDHLKIVTYNVAGWNAANKKGFTRYLQGEDPDIICIQETKLNSAQADALIAFTLKDKYPHQYFHCCSVKKGYSGTAVLSKVKPVNVTLGFPEKYDRAENEGRVITLEFPHVFVSAAYVVNAGDGLKRLSEKLEWNATYRQYLKDLDAIKPIIWCGDLNVSHTELDLARPKTNTKSAGFTPEERADFSTTLSDLKLVDVWRHQHPVPFQQYTYFSYRFQARFKRIGWRLDYFAVSERIVESLGQCVIRDDCYGASDHVPCLLTVPKFLFEEEGSVL